MAHQIGLLVAFAVDLRPARPALRRITASSCWKQRFGFNKMTLRLWLADMVKGALLGAVIGLPLLWVVLTLMDQHRQPVVAVRLAGVERLPAADDGALPDRHRAAVQQVHAAGRRQPEEPHRRPDGARRLRLQGPVRDGRQQALAPTATPTSPASAPTSASCSSTPCWSAWRPHEIEAVLAHELGHFKLKHIVKRIVVMFALSLAFLALLGWLKNQVWFYTGLGVRCRCWASRTTRWRCCCSCWCCRCSPSCSRR